MEPFIDAIVDAIYRAFSIATANTFTVGIVTALIAAGLVLLFKERKMGATEWSTSPEPGAAGAPSSAGLPEGS